ncbi:MAG: YfbM family protein [Gemmatimonadota bacterium]
MGMVAMFRRLADAELSQLREDAELATEYLSDATPDGFGPYTDLDVDKAWHAIHFLLTGTAWGGEHPFNFVVTGGTEIGEDLGYGPAHGFTSAEVREIAAALELLPVEQFMARFNPIALEADEIYPEIWDRPAEADDTRGYVAEHYDALRTFVMEGAAAGDAMIVSFT